MDVQFLTFAGNGGNMNSWLLLTFRVAPPYLPIIYVACYVLAQLSGTYAATKKGNFIIF